jgi:hypothetical protein
VACGNCGAGVWLFFIQVFARNSAWGA